MTLGTAFIERGVRIIALWQVAIVVMVSITTTAFAQSEAELWAALKRENHVALLRHALAPGTGDPADFNVEDCSTQRNLNEVGRDQAQHIGERFRKNGIADARVLSSQWCRCLETAELLQLGDVEAFPIINSFFQRPANREPQMRALRDWLSEQNFTIPTVLVSHQVNITALTGIFPKSGELVIIRVAEHGTVDVIGTIETRLEQ